MILVGLGAGMVFVGPELVRSGRNTSRLQAWESSTATIRDRPCSRVTTMIKFAGVRPNAKNRPRILAASLAANLDKRLCQRGERAKQLVDLDSHEGTVEPQRASPQGSSSPFDAPENRGSALRSRP